MSKQFVHLHVHSHYSLLDGAAKVKDLVNAAAAYGMPALALTDHGNLFGALEFYQAAHKANIKPIIGYEAYIAPQSRLHKDKNATRNYYHLTLLAKNYQGYKNLIKMASEAYMSGFYYKPRIDREVLSQHSEGIIALSGCLAGEGCQHILDGNVKKAEETLGFYRDLFGKDHFYVELQENKLQEQNQANDGLLKLATSLKLPLVFTNDVHYLRHDDAKPHDILLCIQTGARVTDNKRFRFNSNEYYLKSSEQMYQEAIRYPQAAENTVAIAEMVDIHIPLGQNRLPVFTPPDGKSSEEYLRELCEQGLQKRYGNIQGEVQARFEREFRVICNMGFAAYFLIVWDFINFARSQGIPVGPGRGSAAGSIVAFALGITNLDPLKYQLIFERFLNEGRNEMPDIDIDFETERRGEVIDYVTQKYGRQRVAQIITFGTMAARAAIRDVGRVMNIPLPEVDKVAKKVPQAPKMTIEKGLATDPEFAQIYESDPTCKELIDVAKRLEGLNRQPGIHAAGVIIADKDITEYCPLYKDNRNDDGAVVTQYSMDHLVALGLLKMDFLGLNTLTLIQKTLEVIKSSQGISLDIDNIPLDDEATYRMLTRGETNGVFQLESAGMRELLKKLRPDRFEDLVALVALYRPGPLKSGMVDVFCRCKHGEEQPVYKHPILKNILEETYGVILYQEQVMQIAKELAGFDLSEADRLRKAMGKKIHELMEKYRKKFIEGAAKLHHVEPKLAEEIFDLIDYFSGYGFNKSHSAAYALVTYQTAYCKAHYPIEFIAALMTIESQNTEKIARYLHEENVEVLPPDVNHSEASFSVHENKIRFGLAAIKGMGSKAVEEIVATRKKIGHFNSIFHLCENVDTRVINKQVLESLVKSGSLDGFARPRRQLFEVIATALQLGSNIQKERSSNQMTLFDFDEADPSTGQQDGCRHLYPDVEDWSEQEKLKLEKETLGLYLSSHPLKRWGRYLAMLSRQQIGELTPTNTLPTLVGGMVAAMRTWTVNKKGKNQGRKMAHVTLEDMKDDCTLVCFPNIFEAKGHLLQEDAIVFVKGKMNADKESAEIIVEDIIPFAQGIEDIPQSLLIHLEPDSEDMIYQLRKLCGANRGDCKTLLEIESGDHCTLIEVAEKYYLRPNCEFLQQLEQIIGTDNVILEGV